jgi:hypothetical protein
LVCLPRLLSNFLLQYEENVSGLRDKGSWATSNSLRVLC